MCLFRNLLESRQDLDSDREDEDEFVPSKKELQSSSEEEEEEAEAGLDSDDEVVMKKSRHAAAGSRTPRSKQKSRSSTRTPRKTPNKKVKVQTDAFLRWSAPVVSEISLPVSSLCEQVAPGTPRTPRHATPSIPSRSLPARQPANVLEEARTR